MVGGLDRSLLQGDVVADGNQVLTRKFCSDEVSQEARAGASCPADQAAKTFQMSRRIQVRLLVGQRDEIP